MRFLDPCTKSGVFLREITSRLTKGLADEMPNLEDRVDHILTKQVFGIGITHLTSLLARRSLYCSKHAKGAHSIANSFTSDQGNIWFERTEHTWVDGRCKYCGASRKTLDRGEGLETHAYAFIHTDDIKARVAELFGGDMQFDVIIGNPPYQRSARRCSATDVYAPLLTTRTREVFAGVDGSRVGSATSLGPHGTASARSRRIRRGARVGRRLDEYDILRPRQRGGRHPQNGCSADGQDDAFEELAEQGGAEQPFSFRNNFRGAPSRDGMASLCSSTKTAERFTRRDAIPAQYRLVDQVEGVPGRDVKEHERTDEQRDE